MKRFLLASAALAALIAPAAAADLATRYPVKAIAAPVFSWTGFYVGGNFGYGGDKFDFNEVAAAEVLPGYNAVVGNKTTVNSSGFFVGGQVGYNYQFANNVVLGVEADLQWSNIEGQSDGRTGYAVFDGADLVYANNAQNSVSAKLDYFGTIRARLGYAFDRVLPYVTGGAAYGKIKVENVGWTDPTINALDGTSWNSSTNTTNWGWTVGAGLEYAITNNWTFKTEYLYVDLGSVDYGYMLVPQAVGYSSIGVAGDMDAKFHTIKAGVNYKF